MDETQGGNVRGGRPAQPAPAGYVYEFGTWRLVPSTTVQRTYAVGSTVRRKGG